MDSLHKYLNVTGRCPTRLSMPLLVRENDNRENTSQGEAALAVSEISKMALCFWIDSLIFKKRNE